MERPQKLCVCTQCLSLLSAACPKTERKDSLGKYTQGAVFFLYGPVWEAHRLSGGSEVIGGDAACADPHPVQG